MRWLAWNRGAAPLLEGSRGRRAMTAVLAILVFLTVLATAMGLGTLSAGRQLERQLSGRLTVQVVEGEAVRRDRLAARVLAVLRATPGVARATPVDPEEIARLLQPWLGTEATDAALPVPALIDVDLASADDAVAARVAEVARGVAPAVRVDRQQGWMSPVSGLLQTLALVALALVAMLAAATAAVVVLAARAGLDAHRATIEVMHMLGSTDRQLARLFQRRIALDAMLGGMVGGAAAAAVAAVIGIRVAALRSELASGVLLGAGEWAALAAVPLVFILLAMIAARLAVTRALRRVL
ncbi:permease [Sphingomonas sp. KR1UV-12]|uniref:Permease n=1 Tax=Sphingomonas aurea TaxID=3063994 RepID=A0ABT9ELF4_9SPHN|nr:FtsX-like permease family protein [Sphingomonas sp. KR1UV-12]MDP1027680.1 permease [Sphingomonas sp. KR1UV-12]